MAPYVVAITDASHRKDSRLQLCSFCFGVDCRRSRARRWSDAKKMRGRRLTVGPSLSRNSEPWGELADPRAPNHGQFIRVEFHHDGAFRHISAVAFGALGL